MGRLGAIFVAICMALIAGSVGVVAFLWYGFTGMEATVVAIAALTALAMLNSVTSRARDRGDLGAQIADLSRGTADLGRQISELDRRMVALEGELAAANERNRAATDPLGAEIDELGHLVKELADAVAAHERMLARAPLMQPAPQAPYAAPAPVRAAPPPPMATPAAPATAVAPPIDPPEEFAEPQAAVARADSGLFKGLAQGEVVALIGRAIEANRIDLFLQPIVTLPQRKVRYYEALTRLRGEDDTHYTPDDYLPYAEAAGLTPAIDNLLVFRCVQVLRRLTSKNREVGLFCNISSATLVNPAVFQEVSDFLEANRALAQFLVFQFSQSAVRAMGPIETEGLATLAALGFRFSVDQVGDLRIEPRELAERGFRFLKVPASLLLSRAISPGADIHPADFSDLLGRFGIDLIADRIERESTVVDLLDYDVRFGQGSLFSPPRPVRAEVLQGLSERPATDLPPAAPRSAPEPSARGLEAEPRPAPPPSQRPGAIAQLARGIVRRA